MTEQNPTKAAKAKNLLQRGVRQTLVVVDKGLKVLQAHPVATERTAIILGTAIATRAAVKKFSPPIVKVDLQNADVLINEVEKFVGAKLPVNIVKTLTPEPLDYANVNTLFHFEVSDQDLDDMWFGGLSALTFNPGGTEGRPDFPLVLLPYKMLLHEAPHIPKNETVENIFAAAKQIKPEGTAYLMDEYFGKR